MTAEAGNVWAQRNMGHCCYHRKGVTQNREVAVRCCRRAPNKHLNSALTTAPPPPGPGLPRTRVHSKGQGCFAHKHCPPPLPAGITVPPGRVLLWPLLGHGNNTAPIRFAPQRCPPLPEGVVSLRPITPTPGVVAFLSVNFYYTEEILVCMVMWWKLPRLFYPTSFLNSAGDGTGRRWMRQCNQALFSSLQIILKSRV